MVAPVWMNAFIPALEAVGIGPLSAASVGAATMVSGVMVDLALTAVAFRFVRRRWGATSPATASRNLTGCYASPRENHPEHRRN